jgi:hypothetical protein
VETPTVITFLVLVALGIVLLRPTSRAAAGAHATARDRTTAAGEALERARMVGERARDAAAEARQYAEHPGRPSSVRPLARPGGPSVIHGPRTART